MSPTMKVNLGDIRTSLRDWPNEPVTATIKDAEMDVSANSGEPMVVLTLELYHPEYGEAELRDYLPHGFPDKVAAFYQAFNHVEQETYKQMVADKDDIEIDPDELIGGQLIVQLGEQEGRDGKIYKNITTPWYYPDDRDDVLSDAYFPELD